MASPDFKKRCLSPELTMTGAELRRQAGNCRRRLLNRRFSPSNAGRRVSNGE